MGLLVFICSIMSFGILGDILEYGMYWIDLWIRLEGSFVSFGFGFGGV